MEENVQDCEECGSIALELQESTSYNDGTFEEKWVCEFCGAEGTISGYEDDPAKDWDKKGQLFE